MARTLSKARYGTRFRPIQKILSEIYYKGQPMSG